MAAASCARFSSFEAAAVPAAGDASAFLRVPPGTHVAPERRGTVGGMGGWSFLTWNLSDVKFEK